MGRLSGFSENGGVSHGPPEDQPGGAGAATAPFRFRRVARRRFPVRTVVVLGSVLVLAGTAVLVLPDLLRHRGDDRAIALLDSIVPADETIPAGRYRVVTQVGWHLHRSDDGDQLVESEVVTWEPSDPSAEWIRESRQTGAVRPLTAAQPELPSTGVDVVTGHCGVFLGEDADGCTMPGSWYVPTPDFLAGLPRDPRELLAVLRAEGQSNGQGDGAVIGNVADLLAFASVPADLRIALCQALLLIEGVDVAEGGTDLLGRSAIVVSGLHPSGHREEILLDPADGSFLGRRQTAVVDTGVPVGTVVSEVAVTSDLADRAEGLAVG